MAVNTLLEEALESWRFAREGVIEELKNLPENAMDHRPAEESRSVAELVLHIVESGLMMSGELTRPDGDFRRQPFERHMAEHAGHVGEPSGKAELLRLLEESHADGERKLREAGELAILQTIRRFDGELGTRLAWLYHGVDHESYHRGQLALYARTLGRVPALTRLIQGTG